MNQNIEYLRIKVDQAPKEPGCYLWKDNKGGVLYIGKAVNIKKRVGSYLINYERLDPKIKKMLDVVADVEYLVVDSEAEALILETNLIKKYKPKYNRLMKDDKNYTWVQIDWYRNFPSVKFVREKDDKKAEYYGPYPQRFPIQNVLSNLRHIYPYCNQIPRAFNLKNEIVLSGNTKPCLDYHIGLCSGVCAGLVTQQAHRQKIKAIRDFLKGKKNEILESKKELMQSYAKNLEFEKAEKLKNLITNFEYATQQIRIGQFVDENMLEEIKEGRTKKALTQIGGKLGIKFSKKSRIECFDISNIQGKNAVGSMVVFQDGQSAKTLYRKFKIKIKETPDDFEMMSEVLTRRLKYLTCKSKKDKSLNQSPDLIIVDGGKGQLSAARKVLDDLNLEIWLAGLAKREEEVFTIEMADHSPIFKKSIFPKRGEALYLLQRIRDEAHRFAIGYHKNLRSKGQTKSMLDDIPGVGEITKRRLIKAFGSLEGIKKASFDELSSIVRNSKTAQGIAKILG
jgi:excinuclease ABC subunit C